jgi:hypothetical protein
MQTEYEGPIRPAISLSPLMPKVKQAPAAATVVVYPCDETSLRGAVEAAQAGITVQRLSGRRPRLPFSLLRFLTVKLNQL